MTELDLAEDESELSVWSWTPNVPLTGRSSARMPALAYFNGQSYMVHNGSSGDSTKLFWSRRDEGTGTWSQVAIVSNQRADGSPSLAVFGGRLHMFYNAAGQQRMVQSTFDPATRTWSSPVVAGTVRTDRAITAPSTVVVDGKLYLGYCKYKNRVDHVQVDMLTASGQWQPAHEVSLNSEEPSCRSVALGNTGGILHTMWIEHDGGIHVNNWGTYTYDSQVGAGVPRILAPRRRLSWESKKPVSILSCGGNTHLLHGGNDSPNQVYWTFWDGVGWARHAAVDNQASHGGAALGCANGQTYMIHNGGDDRMYYSEFR